MFGFTFTLLFAFAFHPSILLCGLFFLLRIAALEVFDVVDVPLVLPSSLVADSHGRSFRVWSTTRLVNCRFVFLLHFLLLADNKLLSDPLKNPKYDVERIEVFTGQGVFILHVVSPSVFKLCVWPELEHLKF